MAGGLEWSRSVQPLLTTSHSVLDKNDIPEIVKTIIKSETDILEHEDQYEQFYSSFVALATHYLSHSLTAVPKTSWNNLYEACKILMKYLLDRLQNYNEGCAITQKMQMFLLKSLCTGATSMSKTDISTFTAILKFAKVPSIVRTETDTETTAVQVKETPNRSRLDIGTDIFDQLTSAFNDLSLTKSQKSDTGEDEHVDAEIKDEFKEETKMTFGKRNLHSLQQLDGGKTLVDVCSRLTFLGRYKERYRDAIGGGSFILPNTLSEALTMRNSFLPLLNEISIVWRAFSLPILEPLTPKRMENIVTVMMSCLYASLSVAVTNTVIAMTSTAPVKPVTGKEEENENYGCSIIQKSLEIFGIVTSAVKSSSRAGGNVAQNVNLMAAWLLLKGLQNIISLTPAVILERKDSKQKTDTKSKDCRPNSAKSSFQGFGAVSVALAIKALRLVEELMNDLQLEGFYQDMGVSSSGSGLDFPIMQSQTAWRRVQKLLSNIPLVDLLLSLVTTSFKKACLLRRLKLGSETSEASSSSASDSITFYEDDFSSSEDSSEEEEEDAAESILGHWMEETMCPSETTDSQAPPPVPARVDVPTEGKRSRKISSGDSPVFIPDKREPAGFVNLAADFLNFINVYFVTTTDSELQKTLKNCLNEDHMSNLSTVIKELDKETMKVGADKTFENLSVSLARLNHSLIATGCLSERLQDVLLEQLNVSPSAVDPWPLTVHPRTLSVLAEVILLKQQKERESKTLKSQSEAAVITIWVRFMTTLKSAIINFDNVTETCEDVNVEHIQLLIFLFHSLPLMQKKSLLLQLAQNIIAISELESRKLEKMVPLLLSRLVLIFEYLLHYFYDPPDELMEQVRWNLFTVHTMKQEGDKPLASLYFAWDDIEKRYRKNLTAQEANEVLKPRFYNIGPIEIRSQDAPKVDGLACSFLLATSDCMSYNLLYDACISLLMVGSKVDKTKTKLTLLDSVSRHSHFLITWRLLSCLPPSIQYLRLLETGTLQMSNGHVLHTLRWTPRCGQKVFISWIKDCLVKQGLTTQQSDALLTAVNKLANTVNFDIRLAMNFIQDQIAVLPFVENTEVLPLSELPSLFSCLMLDCVIAKIQVSLDETFAKAMDDIDPNKTMEIAQDLIPATLLLLEAYGVFARSCILGKLHCEEDGELQVTNKQQKAYGIVMSIGSTNHSTTMLLAREIMATLPRKLSQAIDKWTTSTKVVFPGNASWKGDYSNDLIPAESYIEAILSSHIETMSVEATFSVDMSIRHMLSSLVKFASDLTTWCPDTNSSKEMVRVMFPLTVEAAAVSMDEMVWMSLERFLGPADGEEYLEKTFYYCISVCNNLIVNYSDTEFGLEEKVFIECLKFMENHLESKAERKAFEKFFTEKGDLTTLLLGASRKNLSSQFSTYILKFLNRLLTLAEKNSTDTSYEVLCGTLSKLTEVDNLTLQKWLSKMIVSSQKEDEEEKTLRENRMLLRNITIHIVKEKSSVSEKVALAILSAMIPMGEVILSKEKDTSAFPELMSVMQTLAGAGHGVGHKSLFPAATGWLEICNQQLSEKEVLDSLTDSGNKRKAILDTICCLLSYIGDILSALKRNSEKSGLVPSDDADTTAVVEADSDWAEDIAQEDEDSAAEDSDEESLNNKLCTFTVTQKEFMNQHWYHCHDCKMVEGVGVCTVCAKVCHKGHDLTYAKFGSFFCDCGAKDDSTCKALVKRSSQVGMDTNDNMNSQSPFSMDNILPSSLRRRMSATGMTEKPTSINKVAEQVNKAREALCKQVEGCKELLLNQLEQSQTVKTVLTMLETILPTLTENYQKVSPMGSTKRAQKALHDLHNLPKTTENTENLMTVTLGSQEGAFENVRMNYSGDQGQTIRQLITAHMIRRVAMCVLASTQGKRQHLAVSHEKGKITILQLSALLKQADSSKKKLTLTRLASAPIPFTVLSITGNPCNEDFLAVCGLKDCHVLTFTSAGSVADHLVLHPTLTTGNFIIKAIWLPGTQTELAIVTADFVKIYNLGSDALSPQYFFLLPSGKIRDATFVTTEDGCHMVLMASTGYIYTQVLEETSSAKHGPFYITNVLEINHDDLKETNGNVAGGGVSVYYSHALQLLFFSYAQGKSFAATVTKDLSVTSLLFQISLKSNGTSKGSNSSQPLVQWSEVPGHVGLMYCMTQSTNNPVVLMIKPDAILVQEIKVVPAKAKIQDVVAIRHTASNSDQQRTTMILLCEDGSLRIYMANTENTCYWLSPYLQPQSPIAVLKPAKKKKVTRSGHTTGSVSFPVDFFEHCYQTNDIEFGGNDLLQLYNTQQIKHRLTAIGMYVASTKPAGFTIEINNTNATNVMVGLRVQIGTQSIERVPSYLEIFSRSVPVTLTKARWYDLPFTREESLTADKKVTLFVGASADSGGVTMVDSIKVYVKTKESFGWPEETDEFPESSVSKVLQQQGVVTVTESETVSFAPLPLTCADRLLGSALEVLDGAFVNTSASDKDPTRETALTIATKLLTLPTPPSVQQHTKSLMASLFPNMASYYNHKDQAQLVHVMDSLSKEELDLDVEAYQRLLVTARSVAVARASNLVKFAETGTSAKEEILEVTDLEEEKEVTASWSVSDSKDSRHFVTMLTEAFWKLHSAKPANSMLAPVCLPGLSHVDATVSALVEIINAFTLCDLDTANLATKLYVRFLMSPVQTVSFACKQAIIRSLRPRHRRRRVFIPSPPRCSSPGGGDDDDGDNDDNDNQGGTPVVRVPAPTPPTEQEGDEAFEVVEQHEPMEIEQSMPGRPIGLEELLSGGVNFPPMVDIPPDADDETMVELAIALSLQEQPGSGSLGLQGLRLAAAQQIDDDELEQGPLSDTTASAPGSDDENGSNAATDGSTLRTSPAEQAGSGGSESGGSAPESISGDQNVSGRSSVYGDKDRETGGRSETSSLGLPSTSLQQDTDADYDATQRLHSLRLILLERLLHYLPEIREVGGVRAIPYMQVLLMLTSDLDSEEEKDKAALDTLLTALIKELDLFGQEKENVACRNQSYEFKLVLLRLLSVLLSRTKAGTKASGESSSFISNSTASALISSGAITYCLNILKSLLPYWKQYSLQESDGSPVTGCLLKPHPSHPPPDMSPFFLRQYVKGHASDVFEDYPQLLTEMVLRLPYQLKKISESNNNVMQTNFDSTWNNILSEYMMTQQTPFVKRQVRKLLMFICGTKEKYRELRDLHAVEMHLNSVMKLCKEGGLPLEQVVSPGIILPYDTLLSIIEHLKACSEVATSRPVNWQLYCKDNQNVLSFLIRASIMLDEGVAPTLLQLLQCALCGSKMAAAVAEGGGATSSPSKQKKDKDKDKDKNEDSDDGQKVDETLCVSLIQLLNKVVDPDLMINFIRTFLLESNSTSIRWQAHSLVFYIYKNCTLTEQENMMEMMWSLWKELALYGRKAAQFVDLLGYFVLKTPQTSEKKTKEYLEKAIAVLRDENNLLTNHPNAQIYNMLQGLVDFDGYYLESDPCLVCNNPEVPYTSLKLSAIKVDSKFTTTTQIIKLVGSHNISKISLRISDLKRTKMVRVINFYYNNRTVQAVVELKNKPGIWHKAKTVVLTSGQTDVKVEFPIPIVACNLMIEYADFYDNLQATAETLQCPRCSASVPASPGVCGNCGENVFQCHKCRAINYDEKDPFLCNACGFCKYAKFDYTLTARQCCAVDPIENEEDRKKAITTINTLLEKADRIYKQLQQHRPVLEKLLIQVTEHGSERLDDALPQSGGGSANVPSSNVNKAIQSLALKYCSECKSSFDELSKIIQKVLASRKELVEYDCQQREAVSAASQVSPVTSPRDDPMIKAKHVAPCKPKMGKDSVKASNCYGCASSAVEHCITLLRALVTNTNLRQILCGQGMIKELIDYNLRHGSLQVRTEVRSLLCLLTKDNRRGTEEMNNLIMTRISSALKGYLSNPDLGSSVRHEILLLATSLQQDDSCWEQRIRCVMRLFLMGMQMKNPVITDCVTLPCLRILQHLIKSDNKKEKQATEAELLRHLSADLHVNSKHWLTGDPKHSFQNWRKILPKRVTQEKLEGEKTETKPDQEDTKKVARALYLTEKYVDKWRQKMSKTPAVHLKLTQTTWLQQAMFSQSSRSARQTACNIIESIAQIPSRKKEIVDMLTKCLDGIGKSGESSSEFLALYKKLIQPAHWKYYLAIKGVMLHLGDLITKEVELLQHLEETTLSSDLAQGFALKSLTELLAQIVEQDVLKQHYKNKLVGYVLNGYLSLRKLVVQRTKLIDDTQDKLLELLEELTSGTESETKEFMQVCVKTVKKYPGDDYRSPVFIFERLCSIIFPEENDVEEFLLILEKDPQQEDFLQGRMLGNPYSCNEPGLGPLMRDVKNKICQDCELVALLEDDNGMELLVNKKIISLDLPVKEVYKKVWAPEHGEGEPMPIIYRMRGLLGDATEDMVNSLDSKTEEDVDKEEVYKMASVLSEGDGLRVMLERLASIKDLVLGKQLMTVLLKLFSYAVNVKANRLELLKPEMNTLTVMLGALNLALWAEQESGTSATKGQTITEQVLQIMEVILLEASNQPAEKFREFSKLCGDKDQLMLLLDRINSPFVRSNNSILQELMRLIPFMAFGDEEKLTALINHFKPYLDFAKYDVEHTQDESVHIDCFCVIAAGIENNENGNKLKDMILDNGIVKLCIDYILQNSPVIKTLLPTDVANWKDFLEKPSLSYILRLLTGLCAGHTPTQLVVGSELIAVLHKLEQASSDQHIGTVAENLLEALSGNEKVSEKIEEVRQQTKAEKKKRAMAKREKQLGALGMMTNEKGQVTVKSSVLKQMDDIKEETGLTCCICREGYRCQPQKVLAIYTFTKRVNLDDFDNKPRKAIGYSTVSHFNVIHVDCHTAAVRHARGREEWESAALQNANTKCNGLLPLWGPQVQESAFATCLARHNTYIQDCTGIRDPSYPYNIHDVKHLILKFAQEKSFSQESGGGGRQSNMHVLPAMIHMALYVINTTRSVGREEKNFNNFITLPKEKWLENSYETEGALYWTVMTLHIHPYSMWKDTKVELLKRLLVLAQARHQSATGSPSLSNKTVLEYSVYKPYFVFFGIVDMVYDKLFKKVTVPADSNWSGTLADYIRNNDKPLIEACDKVLRGYEDELLPCESVAEVIDVLGLLSDIPDSTAFMTELMSSMP
ncbi:E3 ubiquitin-protein ligase UBR4-like [Mytilus californianus]|uniref:E3 ubiquitin-protein ligase UBR4-like n=1 Tax=Mytilus californianus TaxID=6549 RepID=UPI00224871F8|nr:E3 ubiquitin-protein ligase UBR4-like [Mytilus californianus]